MSILITVPNNEGLDWIDPNNFRPIANVTFQSKIIEKVVAAHLTLYLDRNNLLPKFQSGFRKGRSTETLLVHLLTDTYAAIDRSHVTLLALFKVSAAFNIVHHDELLRRLSTSFSLSGKSLT